ncbi:carboxypeptidase-like regulatory domain-containing protein [Sediminibacterium roseum]|uniref:Carboxypeptidase-like regulatory domain-containing protein n=1 Tax=Sediminibacterium roseum TaxID=1978412 RepID=A0ABW9ZV19_9BACT|nr:carboxypeptidase-like regulatory domain-containing protein [Sediminibacterium roseum]NCI51003.1 carboxypeptidase-like regulatory domain-containing protein [Sediminibacterium roseum]
MRSAFIFLFCLFTSVSFAQALKGRVLYADTRRPVVGASVFLANTSIGTVTQENGEFVLPRFPEGSFDLVVSFVGYESFTLPIRSNRIPENIEVVLKPKVDELKEVILEPYEKDGWQKWGRFFLENFIGMSAGAEDCKLLNKEVLRFRLNRKENTLYVSADDRILIENRHLGYHLTYDLVNFQYNMRTHVFLYQGYPLFRDIETKRSAQKRRWLANREASYYGSIMHFMRSLYRNKLIEQEFDVKRIIKIPNTERERISQINRAKMTGTRVTTGGSVVIGDVYAGLHPDTAAYYRKVMRMPETTDYLINRTLTGDSIAYAIDSTVAGFNFKDYLQVVYKPKMAPVEFYRSLNQAYMEAPVTSQIKRTSEEPMMVWSNGTYYEGTTMISSGYWGFSEKIAELLPIDYWPPPKKAK